MPLRRPERLPIVWRMQTHTTTIDTAHLEQRRFGGQHAGETIVSPAPSDTNGAPSTDRLLTADEVAVVLGVPRTFVYSLARRGVLPTVRIGERYVRFRGTALGRWISDQETTRPKGTQ
jgi:excisionase family DNA binding protein